ncbi:hypothetical protein DER46DRAFT_37997 [Fusarium sp. MPI-SDFR-AT-0072]|nr:hypothetical protein DER46DRAFT_37997 [Fusarium sp. MPI-SDFR-AT-0072]
MSLTDSSRSARRPSFWAFFSFFFLFSSGEANPSKHHSHSSSQRHCVSTKSRAPEPGPDPVDPETHPKRQALPGLLWALSLHLLGRLVPGAGKTRPRSDTKPQTKILCALLDACCRLFHSSLKSSSPLSSPQFQFLFFLLSFVAGSLLT